MMLPRLTLLSALLLLGADRPDARRPPTPQPYYAYGVYPFPLVADLTSEEQAPALKIWLKGQEIPSVHLKTAGGMVQVWPRRGRDAPLESVPAVAMEALIDIFKREQPGAHVDVLVRDKVYSRVPVSVTWELDRSIVVSVGGSQGMAPPDVGTVEEVAERWDITLRNEGGASWGESELYLIDTAMALLTETERACIREVPLVISDADPQGLPGTIGVYNLSTAARPDIIFYTDNIDQAWTSFLGSTGRPTPFTVHLILHEIGHAIGDTAWRRGWETMNPQRLRYSAASQAAIEATGGRQEALRDHPALAEELRAAHDALVAIGWSKELEDAAWTARLEGGTPVVAWSTEMGDRWRPTAYGSSDDIEGFAEFFALAHTDPAAMRRSDPDIVDWFERGTHLSCEPMPLPEVP